MLVGKRIRRYKEIDSTNDEAKRLVKAGEPEGTVIIAKLQTKGRGKPGSQWFSPKNSGLYLSVILKPLKNIEKLDPLILLGAQASLFAIEKVCGQKAGIKKPNDVILEGKKVGGILVERVDTTNAIPSIVIGIGLNVNMAGFPKELAGSATSLKIICRKDVDQPKILEALLEALDKGYSKFLKGSV